MEENTFNEGIACAFIPFPASRPHGRIFPSEVNYFSTRISLSSCVCAITRAFSFILGKVHQGVGVRVGATLSSLQLLRNVRGCFDLWFSFSPPLQSLHFFSLSKMHQAECTKSFFFLHGLRGRPRQPGAAGNDSVQGRRPEFDRIFLQVAFISDILFIQNMSNFIRR